jgi:hypothetical protein
MEIPITNLVFSHFKWVSKFDKLRMTEGPFFRLLQEPLYSIGLPPGPMLAMVSRGRKARSR